MSWRSVRTAQRRRSGQSSISFIIVQGRALWQVLFREGGGYGVPLSYVWDGDARIYVHCAPEGRKLCCLDRCAEVSFCVVGRTRVIPSKFTTAYESVVLQCRAVRGLPPEERMDALRLLLEKYAPEDCVTGLHYAEKSFHRTEILRLEIRSGSGKQKKIL